MGPTKGTLAAIMLLLLLQSVMPTVVVVAEDWPQFRADSNNTGSRAGPAPAMGQVLWQYSVNETIRSSPAVVDGKVFFGDMAGMVWALDAETGEFIWSYDTGSRIESSPAYLDGTVLIGDNDGRLHALDAGTGAQVWEFGTDGDIRTGVTIVERTPDVTLLLFGSYDNNLYALDADGDQVWNYTARSYVHGKPSVLDNLTFTCTCDKDLYAIDVDTGDLVWNLSLGEYSGISPPALDDHVYPVGLSGKVMSVDIAMGEIEWTNDTGSNIEASPALGNRSLFVGTTGGEMIAFDLDTGDRDWVHRVDGAIYSSPALVDGYLFFGDRAGVLHALQAEDGKELWNLTVDGAIDSSPAVAYGKVYFGTDGGTLYAVSDTRPLVRITGPEEWAKVKGKVKVGLEVYGKDITSVEVSIDGKTWTRALPSGTGDPNMWEVTLDTKKVGNGSRELKARATNATGEGLDSIHIIIKNPKVDNGFIPGPGTVVTIMAVTGSALLLSLSCSSSSFSRRSSRKD